MRLIRKDVSSIWTWSGLMTPSAAFAASAAALAAILASSSDSPALFEAFASSSWRAICHIHHHHHHDGNSKAGRKIQRMRWLARSRGKYELRVEGSETIARPKYPPAISCHSTKASTAAAMAQPGRGTSVGASLFFVFAPNRCTTNSNVSEFKEPDRNVRAINSWARAST